MTARRASLLVVLALVTSACGGGVSPGPTPTPTPTPTPSGTGTVTGILTDTRGGPPLGGATVAVEGTSLATATNAGGAFSITGVPAGTRSLLLTKTGYGAGRLQGVGVAASVTTDVRMHLRTVFDSARPVSAPTIAVSGLTPGATVSGTVAFTVTITAANPVRLIQWRFGHRGDVANGSASDTSAATVVWNTTLNANGPSFVNIIAYDNNYNVAEWSIPVTVANTGGSPPAAPASVYATAVTFGRPVSIFQARLLQAQRQARAARMSELGRDPGVVSLGGGRFLNIKAAPPDSTLLVYVLWSPVPGAVGYKVYRSFSAGGPFVLLADAGAGASSTCQTLAPPPYSMDRCHRDSGADLAAGTAVYYKVTAYAATGESALSTGTAQTTPLPVFNLNLVSPPDETNTIAPGSAPTFTWTPTAVVGTTRYYEGYVWGINDDPPSYYFCTGSTNVTFGSGPELCYGATTPLQRAKRYEWDVWYAYAYDGYGAAGDAYSMAGFPDAGPGFPFFSSGSLNGPFRFTTTP